MLKKEMRKKIVNHILFYIKNLFLTEEDFQDIFFEVTKRYIEEWDKKEKVNIKAKTKEYNKLFEYQLSVLEYRKVPKKIIEEIKKIKKEIVTKAISLNIPDENIAFFPVIKNLKSILEKTENLPENKIWKIDDKEEYKFYFVFNIFTKKKYFLERNFDFLDEDEYFCLQLQNINYRQDEDAHPYFQILS